MEQSEIVKNLWSVAKHCHEEDGNLELFDRYIAHAAGSSSDSWIFQPGDSITIGNNADDLRDGIISQLISEDMNQEARSEISVIFAGTYKEQIFKTKEILTKENSDRFLVIQGKNEVFVRRNDPNEEVRTP
ncbi:MAG: hypothetical protein AAGA60_15785 [Cyanobacteria bacterium P01_E01_bin.42]